MKQTYTILISILLYSIVSSAQDHIEHPLGPPPSTVDYKGKLEVETIYLMPANPEKGFYWPYYLGTPKTIKENIALYVEPNNDGRRGEPFETHAYWASIICEHALYRFANELETFALVPVFPRPKLEDGNNLYTHALTRAVVENMTDSLKRIDLQLIAMIEDAQCKIRRNNYEIRDKFMLWGFSGSGDFVTRMAMIHPEKIQCMVAGGLGGFPILPMSSLEGVSLNYPVGISDFEKLFNKKFNANAFKLIPMKLFQGDIDENDSVSEGDELSNENDFISDSYSYAQCRFINQSFGHVPVNRVAKVSDLYSQFGMQNFNYVIVPNVDHKITPIQDEALKFFIENCSEK